MSDIMNPSSYTPVSGQIQDCAKLFENVQGANITRGKNNPVKVRWDLFVINRISGNLKTQTKI